MILDITFRGRDYTKTMCYIKAGIDSGTILGIGGLMKHYSTRVVIDSETLEILEKDYVPYDGPWALADRSLQKKASQAADTASATGNLYGGEAGTVGASIIPGLEREAQGGQGFTPTEKNNMLVAGEQGAGGAAGSLVGQGELAATRTRNAAGIPGALDEAMREKGRTLSQNALGVENESAKLAQEKQQKAQGMLAGIREGDINAQLRSMGMVPEDINAGVNAQKVGWFQNMNELLRTLEGGANSAAALGVKV